MSSFGPEILPDPPAPIAARTRGEAMDWSLVLASQGIETTIKGGDGVEGWGLEVAPADRTLALEAIRKYQLENRGWPWQQPIGQTGELFDWGCLAWSFLVILFFQLQGGGGLVPAGIMDTAARGEWWRLFTATWLHADLAHLGANVTLGTFLLGLVMGRFGTGAGLFAACLTGAGGNLVALIASQPHRSLGASGLIMGCLGLLTVPSVRLWHGHPRASKYLLSAFGGGLMLFVLLGLSPGTDVMAHFGGFVCGLVLGGLGAFVPGLAQRSKINLASGLIFAALVIVPWWFALRR